MPEPWFREHRERGERSTLGGEHVPVLLAECLAALAPRPGHVIIDGTLGYAGHAAELLQAVGPGGRLIACDLDPGTLPAAEIKLAAVGNPFTLHHGTFAGIQTVLAELGIEAVDGLLADLGMSSMQVDDPARGFSYMRDGPLDMRMDPARGPTASDLLHTMSEDALATAFTDLGDEPQANAIAAEIVRVRGTTRIERTGQLRDLITRAAPVHVVKSPGKGPARKQEMLPTTRVFQALRILVNRELASLQQLLRVLPTILKPGGGAAIIAFHSGEDRLVKAAFREGLRTGVYSEATDDPIRPGEVEKAANPRSRSAKLRWARRASWC